MTDNCDDCNKCYDLYGDFDEDDDQYIIERLEDIVKISNYLIKVLKHKKMKKEMFDKLTQETEDPISEDTDFNAEEFLNFLKALSKNQTYYPKKYEHRMRYPYSVWF